MSMTAKKKNKVSIGFWLEADELDALKAKAKEDGRSVSSYIRRLFFTSGCITTGPDKKGNK